MKSRKKDDPEQYGRRESLPFSSFEVKENESKEKCEHVVKSYIKNSLIVDIGESECNRIHRIGPKIKESGNIFQYIIVKFRDFVQRTKVYRASNTKQTSQSI